MEDFYNFYYRSRTAIAESDLLYPIMISLLSVARPRQRKLCAHRDTTIVIEGIPRSANTFFTAYFEEAQRDYPDLKVAGHLHESYQLRFAVKHGIPCVALIRPHDETIPSAILRNPRFCVRSLLVAYNRFFRAIDRLQDGLVIARFETAISQPNNIIERVNEVFGTDFQTLPEERLPEVLAKVKRRDEASLGSGAMDPSRLALPSNEKRKKKEMLAEELKRFPEEVKLARKLYARAAERSF